MLFPSFNLTTAIVAAKNYLHSTLEPLRNMLLFFLCIEQSLKAISEHS